jgi:Zinc carboxypeptidase
MQELDMVHRRFHASRYALLALLLTLLTAQTETQTQTATKITSPKDQWGHNIGDDYFLANYTQLLEYFAKLDKESDRMKIVEIGKSAEGRPIQMAIITSPENHKKLDRYKEISRRLALAEGLTDDQARALAGEGKAVVWIDGGLHATEVLPDRCRDYADPQRRHRSLQSGESGRNGARLELVHEEP